jgi:hypothetical protein
MGKLLPIPALSKPGFFFAKAQAFESMPPEGMYTPDKECERLVMESSSIGQSRNILSKRFRLEPVLLEFKPFLLITVVAQFLHDRLNIHGITSQTYSPILIIPHGE